MKQAPDALKKIAKGVELLLPPGRMTLAPIRLS